LEIEIIMANTFIALPSRGDIVVGELATGKVKFITLATFDLSLLDTTIYETIGVVVRRERYKVLVCYKTIGSNLKYCDRSWWYLSGYTLDGAEHTGIIKSKFASDNYTELVSKTITYTASTMADLVTALNSAFAADDDLNGADWEASIVNGKVRLTCNAGSYKIFGNTTASDGFTLTDSLPEIIASSRMIHINGSAGGSALGNMDKMVAYLTTDLDNATYNPTSEVLNTRRDLGVCLPAYLGTSQQAGRVGQDYCHILREKYGEGETGWLKSLEATKPVLKCGNGILAQASGKEVSEILSSTYTSSVQTTPKAFSAVAAYCHDITTDFISEGTFYLPSIRELAYIMDGIKNGTTASREADDLNKGLYLLNGGEIKNTVNYWSCSCYSTYHAWYFYGVNGYIHHSVFTNTNGVVPVSTITIEH